MLMPPDILAAIARGSINCLLLLPAVLAGYIFTRLSFPDPAIPSFQVAAADDAERSDHDAGPQQKIKNGEKPGCISGWRNVTVSHCRQGGDTKIQALDPGLVFQGVVNDGAAADKDKYGRARGGDSVHTALRLRNSSTPR